MKKEKYLKRNNYKYQSNKEIPIQKVHGIKINKFRSLKDRELKLGENITIIFGKNGTMKSSLMGLLVHPFSPKSETATNPFNEVLKTRMGEVFKFSLTHDNETYSYDLLFSDTKNNLIKENVIIKKYKNRHRIIASGNNKGDGNFTLNTSFLNSKRLFPIVQTDAQYEQGVIYTKEENDFINNFYEKILQSDNFSTFEPIADEKVKKTLGPKDTYYDFNSISAGEDNLGYIVNTLIGFMRASKKLGEDGESNGILAIDEFEATLHPVVQINLFDFLLSWSKKYNIQVLLTTHSLYLIAYAFKEREKQKNENSIVLNMISTAYVDNNNFNILNNIDYTTAYKELTLQDIRTLEDEYKINVICEDKMAVTLIKRILKSEQINRRLNFITDLGVNSASTGNSYHTLVSICKNGVNLLDDTIVVFDSDVPDTALKKIKVFKNFIRLPEPNSLPLEKAIVLYILNLEDSNSFFVTNQKEKVSYKHDFTKKNISLSTNAEDHIKENISKYKEWAKSDPKFSTYITKYVNDNREEIFSSFKNNFVEMMNLLLRKQLIPEIDID